eukprot:4804874-Prymnesium_polylepis.1
MITRYPSQRHRDARVFVLLECPVLSRVECKRSTEKRSVFETSRLAPAPAVRPYARSSGGSCQRIGLPKPRISLQNGASGKGKPTGV